MDIKETDIDFFEQYDRFSLVLMCDELLTKYRDKVGQLNKLHQQSQQKSNIIKKLEAKIERYNKAVKLKKTINEVVQKRQGHLNKLLSKNNPQIEALTKKVTHYQSKIVDLQTELSKRQDYYSQCQTKVRYSTQIEAEMALTTIRNKGDVRGKTPNRYYKCSICNNFHLTSKQKK